MTARKACSRGRQSASSSESGISLVELLVTMMLLGIVLAMITGLYVTSAKSVALGQSMDGSTRVASNASNELTRVIRVGSPLKVAGSSAPAAAFTFAGREKLALYSNIDVDPYASVAVRPAEPRLVQFEITPGSRQLIESRWTAIPATGSWTFNPSATATTKRNLDGPILTASGGDQLFRYFDLNNLEIPAPASGSMNAGDLARIASVQITVKVQSDNSATPVIVTNTVVMPNLRPVTP